MRQIGSIRKLDVLGTGSVGEVSAMRAQSEAVTQPGSSRISISRLEVHRESNRLVCLGDKRDIRILVLVVCKDDVKPLLLSELKDFREKMNFQYLGHDFRVR